MTLVWIASILASFSSIDGLTYFSSGRIDIFPDLHLGQSMRSTVIVTRFLHIARVLHIMSAEVAQTGWTKVNFYKHKFPSEITQKF